MFKSDWESVIAYPATVAQEWATLVLQTAGWYSAVFDPRPDLSKPAREVTVPYAWWW